MNTINESFITSREIYIAPWNAYKIVNPCTIPNGLKTYYNLGNKKLRQFCNFDFNEHSHTKIGTAKNIPNEIADVFHDFS